MFRVSDLPPLGSTTIQLRGKTVTVRALSSAEESAMTAVFPEPLPPLTSDPTRGAAAPPIPNEMDPAYNDKLYRWRRQRLTLFAAAALDATATLPDGTILGYTPAIDVADLRRWGLAVEDEFAVGLTTSELTQIRAASEGIGRQIQKDAEKN